MQITRLQNEFSRETPLPLAPKITRAQTGTIRFNSRLILELQQSLQRYNQMETQSSLAISDCLDDSTEPSLVNAGELLSCDGSQGPTNGAECSDSQANGAQQLPHPIGETMPKLFSKTEIEQQPVDISGAVLTEVEAVSRKALTPNVEQNKKPTVTFRSRQRLAFKAMARSLLSKRQFHDEGKHETPAFKNDQLSSSSCLFPRKIQKTC